MKRLESLGIRRCSLEDGACLIHLRGLTGLRGLFLPGIIPSNSDLANLAGLTDLEFLDLDFSRVTDAGLVHLRGLTKLTSLKLVESQITDAGMVHLSGLVDLAMALALRVESHRRRAGSAPRAQEAHPALIFDRPG